MTKESSDKIISDYFTTKKKVHTVFDYQPDWVEIPMEDCRGYNWFLTNGEGSGSSVVYAKEPFSKEMFAPFTGKVDPKRPDFWSGTIYTQCFLPKWVYRGESHVMISVDTHCDGNKFLMIFDASKECMDEELKKIYKENW